MSAERKKVGLDELTKSEKQALMAAMDRIVLNSYMSLIETADKLNLDRDSVVQTFASSVTLLATITSVKDMKMEDGDA